MRRIPGVTVRDNRFVYVRGLGERYGQTTLDGARLPSPEPDRKSIPLDLFPASFLESLETTKTYTPDKPADFTGGLVEINTKSLEGPITQLAAKAAFNTASTFDPGLGYDNGIRDLPSIIPLDRPVTAGTFSPAELEQIGESFGNVWGPGQEDLPLGQEYKVTIGDQFLAWGRGLDVLTAFNYRNTYERRQDLVERVFAASGLADPETDYAGEATTNTTALGAVLKTSYPLSNSSRLSLSGIYTRTTDDESRTLEGFNLDSNTDQLNTRLRYVETSLFQTQLSGRHLITGLGGLTIDWRGSYATTSRDEPNTREVLYREANGVFLFDTFVQSGSIFHQDLSEDGYSGGLDFELPIQTRGRKGAIKFGGAVDVRDRTVFTRRFRFLPQGVLGDSVRALTPDELFSPENVAPDSFVIQEATFRPDNYDAEQDIYAGYAMIDADILPRLRFTGGARIEKATQFVQAKDLFNTNQDPLPPADLDDTDIVPGINLTYAATDDINIRVAGSRTIGRPEFRELAPFSFANFAGGYLVAGNPELQRSRIVNLDLRWEWFPDPSAVVAVSGFYKFFDDPIETLVLPSTEFIQTWVNVDQAENYGVEFELRSSLGFIASALENITLNSNVTVVESTVNTGGQAVIFIAGTGADTISVVDKERSLQGQSPYVLNVGLNWFIPRTGTIATVLYNRFGDRIDAVGGQALDDILEESRDQFDFVLQQRLFRNFDAKFSASSLNDTDVVFTQGGDVLRSWNKGRSFSFTLTWTPVGAL